VAVVFIPALLRSFAGGRRSVEVAGATVREVIDNLVVECPGLRERLMEGDRLRPGIQAAVDGQVSPAGLREPVGPTSEIHFVSAIAGG
jgi:molybdopterin converting factor small subunit